LTEFGNSVPKQQLLEFRDDDFDADIRVRILHEGENHPTTRETLENLGLISQVTQQSIVVVLGLNFRILSIV
jgi:hypothetical protein